MHYSFFGVLIALASGAAHANRADVRVQAACDSILSASAKQPTATPSSAALREFVGAVEAPWREARYARDLGSRVDLIREEKFKNFTSRELTWSTDWTRELTPLSRSVNVALAAFEGARLLADEPSRFDRWAVIEGGTTIRARMLKRRAESEINAMFTPVRAPLTRILGRFVTIPPAGRAPVLTKEASTAVEGFVDRVINHVGWNTSVAAQVSYDDEVEFMKLVEATSKADAPGTMVYRNRTFTLDLRLTDNLGGVLRLPTSDELQRALIKRQGNSPTRLDRRVKVVELLKYNVANRRWELHQAIRDVTLSEIFD
jgi:hypothetical protein